MSRADFRIRSMARTRESHEVAIDSVSRDLTFKLHEINYQQRTRLLELLREYAWLIPTWCREVHIRMDNPGEGLTGSCMADMPYRMASVMLAPDLFDLSDALQRKVVCHEFLHITLSPLQDGSRDLIRKLTGDMPEGPRDYFKSMHQAWIESVVSDLEFAICQRMDGAVVDRRDDPAPRKKATRKKASSNRTTRKKATRSRGVMM